MTYNEPYVTLTQDNFNAKVLSSSQPVLVDFWAEWCPPCRAIAPAIKDLAGELEGTAVVGKVNIDDEGSLASQYSVSSIPTLLFFRDGEVVDRVVGVQSKSALAQRLRALTTAA